MWSLGARRQLLVASIGGLALFCSGSSFTWVTPLLKKLQSPESEVPMTADESSWVVSFIEIGNLFTPIPAGILVDKWGRKPCLLFAAPLYVLSWLLVQFVRTVPSLYFMRIVQGMAMSVQYTILPMYIAEISGPSIRGALTSIFQGMWYLGVLYQYLIGAFFGYTGLTWFSIGPPMVFMALFVWCPESPYFLLMRGRREDAGKTMAWLRGTTQEVVEPELKAIDESISEERNQKSNWKDIVNTKSGRKALVIIILLSTTEIMSGLTTVLSYISETIAETSGSQEEAEWVTIFLGVSLVLGNILPACLSDRLGRRVLLLVSSSAASVFLAVCAGYFYLKEKTSVDVSVLGWFPYATIILYTNFISFGVGALIPTLQSELFSNSTRGIACGINTLHITILSFTCLKLYQVIGDNFGLYINYSIFTAFTAFGAACIFFLLPETKGKTFAEIQKMLQME